jgi:uncharacterized membrane protein
MNKLKLLMAGIVLFSFLLNAIFAGVAVRIWLRASDESTPTAVLSTLPDELRDDLRSAVFQTDSQIAAAKVALQQSRNNLQSLLSEDQPDLQALQSAMSDVQDKTVRLQTELHAVIFQYYATTKQQ